MSGAGLNSLNVPAPLGVLRRPLPRAKLLPFGEEAKSLDPFPGRLGLVAGLLLRRHRGRH